MFQPEAGLLIVVKRGPNTQEIAGSSPRASFENPCFRVADDPLTGDLSTNHYTVRGH
jgi:hypothetical protein